MSDTTGAGDGDQGAAGAATATVEQGSEDRPLGAAGEKALEEWKTRAKTAETTAKEAKAIAQERDALAAKLAEYEEATKSEQEKALDKARKEAHTQGKSESDAAWASRLIKTDVKAAAREKLADPADALTFLDLSQFEVNDEGDTDEKAIQTALDALLKEKPYLARKPQEEKQKPGSADQGARGTGTQTKDMNSILRDKFAGR